MNPSPLDDQGNQPAMPRPSNRPRLLHALGIALTALVTITASAALAWSLRDWRANPSTPAEAVATTSPITSAPIDRRAVILGAGRLAYQVHCARCHGAEGHGDGPDAERLRPPPRDFAAGHWRSAPTPDAIRKTIVAGIDGTTMPGWGDSLSRRELDGLVAHVLSLAPKPRPDFGEDGDDTKAPEPPDPAFVSLLRRAGFIVEATASPAPPLTLRDLDGNASTLAERHGRPVLILFWGTTCSHCLSEIPAVVEFANRHRDRGLDVLPVCVDESDAAIVRDVAGPGLATLPLYLDPDGTARSGYDVQALPSFALIDRTGRLIARSQGARDWTDPALDDLVSKGLAPDQKTE